MYHLDLTSRSEYKQRPAAGSGVRRPPRRFTSARCRRNKPGGYWIAEADPTAAIDTFRRPFVDHGCSDSRDMRSTRRRQQPQDSLFSQVSANTQTWGSRGRRFESCQPDRRDRAPLSWIIPDQGLLSVSSMIVKVFPLWGSSGDLHDYAPIVCRVPPDA